MNIEDYLEQPQTMIKFNPENANHMEYLNYSRQAMNHSVLETMEWLKGCGVMINPSQC